MAVTIYSTPTCPYCKQAKEFFKEKSVDFTDHDVSADASKAEEMQKKSGQLGVPVIEIGEKILVGFDKSAIESALEEAGELK